MGALLYRGAIRLNLATFFRWTGGLILFVSAGLFAFSIGELQEAGLLPILRGTAFDVSSAVPDERGLGSIFHALFGYQSAPTWLEVVAWSGYIMVAGYFFLRPYVAETRAVEPSRSSR